MNKASLNFEQKEKTKELHKLNHLEKHPVISNE